MNKFKKVGNLFYRINKKGHVGVYTKSEIKFLIWWYSVLNINNLKTKSDD